MTAFLGLALAVVGLFALVAGLVCWLLERDFRACEALGGEED